MPYREAFEAVVIGKLDAIRGGCRWGQPWPTEYAAVQQAAYHHRGLKCQAPINTSHDALAYAYLYYPHHVAAIEQSLLSVLRFQQPPSRILMVDYGCGPATSCSALLGYLTHQRLSPEVDYVGIDVSGPTMGIGHECCSHYQDKGLLHSFAFCEPYSPIPWPANAPEAIIIQFSFVMAQTCFDPVANTPILSP